MRIVTVTDSKPRYNGLVPNGVNVGRALTRLGHSVHRISQEGITREALAGAELVLSFGTVVRAESQRPGYFRQINTCKDAGAISALWYFDMCNPKQSHSPYKPKTIMAVAKQVDWLITTDHSYPWEQYAKSYMFLPQGVEPEDFRWSVLPPEPRKNDVIFTGGVDHAFAYRQRYLDALSDRFRVSAFGRGHRVAVYGINFFAAHQRARVALVPPPHPDAADHYWSNRIFLAAATGTPCVVGYVPGIEDYYEDGKEVVYFRTASECVANTRELIDDPKRRKQMGDAARARTLTEHSYDSRARTLMSAIFGQGATH